MKKQYAVIQNNEDKTKIIKPLMSENNTRHEHNLAAVDVGTNSSHMIIASLADGGAFKIVDRQKHWVRLGDGLDKKGHIDQAAIERLIESLHYFKQLASSYQAPLICIATSALRDATNQARIISEVKKQTGLRLDVVSGKEEARLIFQGVRSSGHMGEDPVQIIDIGGGSTEVIVGTNTGILAAESLDMGVRRFARKYFADHQYKQRHIRACRQEASSKIQSIVSALQGWDISASIGTSGTIRAQAALAVELVEAPLPHYIRLKDLHATLPLLIDGCRDGKSFPGIDAERLATLVPGNIILQEVMTALDIKSLGLSQNALREGIIFDHTESLGAFSAQPMRAAVAVMARQFNLDINQIERVTATADHIFTACLDRLDLTDEGFELLHAACSLHEIGLCVSHKRMHIHGGYMVNHADITGVTRRQQQILAAVIRFHRKAKPRKQYREFLGLGQDDVKLAFNLAAILRLAAALNRTKQGQAAQPIIKEARKGLHWQFDPDWWSKHEVCILNAREEKRPLEKLLDSPIRFVRKR